MISVIRGTARFTRVRKFSPRFNVENFATMRHTEKNYFTRDNVFLRDLFKSRQDNYVGPPDINDIMPFWRVTTPALLFIKETPFDSYVSAKTPSS